ncbi:Uma2 family endonuclease [Candidatus Leptofilum sp.]|uniref:Uma2 family endonuclease n=1 Tax=Candidatus Leptofilum sp. TaxID=3241576 RepID=UPI003B5CB13C
MAIAELTKKLITGEELLELEGIGPCELVAGEIVKMSPTNVEHAFLESEIAALLRNFVARQKTGWVLTGEVGVYTQRNPDSIRAGDVVFISKERASKRPRRGFLEIAPELVVEIVSPNDRWADLHDKIDEYFGIGVQWVWVVEPTRQVIRVYRAPTQVEIVAEQLQGEGVLAGFELSVTDLFAE